MFTRPYVVVFPGRVRTQAMIGPVKREYPYDTLRIDGSKLIAVGPDGAQKRTTAVRWMAHKQDWAASSRPGCR